MSQGAVDRRRPLEVTADFRASLAQTLAAHGFAPRARGAKLVRKRGRVTHAIELGSSHRNGPGDVTCFVSLAYEDASIEDFRAGGTLSAEPFADQGSCNIAIAADALTARIVARLSFFELLDDERATLAEVCRRYVPGFVAPRLVVRYLAARLGEEAVAQYARALLDGRPELWPAFLGAPTGSNPDHGTQLARASGLRLTPPSGTVVSEIASSAHLRCFIGRQLRAWGEPGAAASLRRVEDGQIKELHDAQTALGEPITRSLEAARLALVCVGQRREPRQPRPSPELFQYHVLHAPFAGSARVRR